MFEVRFDYGELDDADPTGQPEKPWPYRPDPFSTYRSGFEVRTCRRCERVLMFHHFPDQPAGPGRAAQPDYRPGSLHRLHLLRRARPRVSPPGPSTPS